MSRAELFKNFEKKLKAVNQSIELFRLDYAGAHLVRIVIRFPQNEELKRKMSRMGWKEEGKEYVPIAENKAGRREIRGWVPARTGKAYIRMSYSA